MSFFFFLLLSHAGLCCDVGESAEKFVMDPPQRQEALRGDSPGLLRMDPNIPERLEAFPDDDDDSPETLQPGLCASAEANHPGFAQPPPSNRLQPPRPPPPAPTSGPLSAWWPQAQDLGPPPAPPRSRMPLRATQFSFTAPEAAPRLTRSSTIVGHHVSTS